MAKSLTTRVGASVHSVIGLSQLTMTLPYHKPLSSGAEFVAGLNLHVLGSVDILSYVLDTASELQGRALPRIASAQMWPRQTDSASGLIASVGEMVLPWPCEQTALQECAGVQSVP